MWLNADVGEGMQTDGQLYPYLHQANIACGGHAGDEQSMQRAVQACVAHDVIVGAHPSYPDRVGFGRVSMPMDAAALTESLLQQIQLLEQVCVESGAALAYVKPHGALYHDVMRQKKVFTLVLELLRDYPIKLALMLGANLSMDFQLAANKSGIELIREAFIDRRYLANGELMPRSEPGAVFNDIETIVGQAADLKQGQVLTDVGKTITINANSLCLHGDNLASVKAISGIAAVL